MEIIALRGPDNTGKTTTLKIVFEKLKAQGFQPMKDFEEDLGNGDSLWVLEKDGRKVGLVTQGDYAVKGYSVKNHLRKLESAGCDTAICACTTGEGKSRIQRSIDAYVIHDYVDKTQETDELSCDQANEEDANKVMTHESPYDQANKADAKKVMALFNRKKVLLVLLDEYSDWEGAFLSTALHNGVVPGGEVKYKVHVVAPTLNAVRSIGGFRTSPDYSFENMPKEYEALILIGGNRWDSPEAEKVVLLVQKALDSGKLVGAICGGASFLCAHGFLNHVKHTGNGLEELQQWGGERYTNEGGYVNAQAVSDGNVVTANGVAYLEFTREILLRLEASAVESIEMWYDFYKNGFVRPE